MSADSIVEICIFLISAAGAGVSLAYKIGRRLATLESHTRDAVAAVTNHIPTQISTLEKETTSKIDDLRSYVEQEFGSLRCVEAIGRIARLEGAVVGLGTFLGDSGGDSLQSDDPQPITLHDDTSESDQ